MSVNYDNAMRLKLIHAVNAMILVGLILQGIQLWPTLPARVPIHFGLSGEPDRWTDKGFGLGFVFFALPILVSLVIYAGVPIIRKAQQHPNWLTAFTRKQIERTPRHLRHVIFRNAEEMLALISIATLALFWNMNTSIAAVATGEIDALPAWRVWGGIGLVLVVVVWRTIDFMRLSKRLATQSYANSEPPKAA